MSFVFVTLSHDYADEFDVDCAFVATRQEIEQQLAKIRLAFDEGIFNGGGGYHDQTEFYFGTNEALSFYDYDDFARGVVIKDCSEEFYNEFNDLTAFSATGFCVIDRMLEYINDRAEQEDEEDEE